MNKETPQEQKGIQKYLLLLILVIFAVVLVHPVTAFNVSFSDLDLVTVQDVQIYDTSGVLLASVNTSSSNIQIAATDVIMVLKPTEIKRWEDPFKAFADVAVYIETHLAAIVVIVFLIGLLFFAFRRK